MDTSVLTAVTAALGIAVFVRHGDGSFESLCPAPSWFVRVTSGETFPFLGHILEEANVFWRRGTEGRLDWGPVAEVDSEGHEYHYIVTALTANRSQFLVFQLDAGAERMRDVLQKVRTEALSAELDQASHRVVASDLHRTNAEVKQLIAELMGTDPTPAQAELLKGLTQKSLVLANGIGRLIQSTNIPRA